MGNTFPILAGTDMLARGAQVRHEDVEAEMAFLLLAVFMETRFRLKGKRASVYQCCPRFYPSKTRIQHDALVQKEKAHGGQSDGPLRKSNRLLAGVRKALYTVRVSENQPICI